MKTYQHLGSRDIINAVRMRYGIDKEPVKIKDKKTFGGVQCQCGFINPPGLKFCGQCATGLTPEAQQQRDSTMNKLIALLKELPAEKRAEITKGL